MRQVLLASSALVLLLIFVPACSDNELATPENNPPVLPAQADVDAKVGQELTLSFQATDRDGDTINYHLAVYADAIGDPLPDAGIDAETGDFYFTPLERDKPFREFVVEVDDGRGGEDAVQFKVMIAD